MEDNESTLETWSQNEKTMGQHWSQRGNMEGKGSILKTGSQYGRQRVNTGGKESTLETRSRYW